ncbi:MAG: cytochrome c biogenesis protein ResB [Acidobacteriota bacterium]
MSPGETINSSKEIGTTGSSSVPETGLEAGRGGIDHVTGEGQSAGGGNAAKSGRPAQSGKPTQLIDGFLGALSSIPFGIVLLILLIVACMIGMLIQQQELETFSNYYAELTPAEKIVYGNLGFFDIYHAWYFNVLLLLLSLNIILASIDHFPAAWSYFKRKKLTASPTFALAQRFREEVELPGSPRAELAERVARAARQMKFRVRVTEAASGPDGATRTSVFAERGVWNRLGAYAVHVGLLTIFLGFFLTSRGFTGSVPIVPLRTADRMIQNVFNLEKANSEFAVGQRDLELPFIIEGLDIQQKLINKEGGLDAGNTLDWLTRVRIHDKETGQSTEALVHMNSPYDYRGYRLFQASYNPLGNARAITIAATLPNGQTEQVTINRLGEVRLSDGSRLKYSDFNPHLVFSRDGRPDFGSTEYENPAARILFIDPAGRESEFWAITAKFKAEIANAPFLQSKLTWPAGYQFSLTDFEKAPLSHILSVQYDPGVRVVYVGFTILCLTLIGVFFFSHQRLWIVVEDGKIYLGGDANRNRLGFEDRARKLIALVRNR